MNVQFLAQWSMGQVILAGAVPLGIIALYLFKPKRRQVILPSTLFWSQALRELQAHSWWWRLRKVLLLFLQLLAVSLVLLALARPTTPGSATSRKLILLIDQSASMAATDVSPSRLEEAKRQARARVRELGEGESAMVIAFSDRARVVCTDSSDKTLLVRAIDSITPTARGTDFQEALTMAVGWANQTRGAELTAEISPEIVSGTILIYSDGNATNPWAEDFARGGLRLEYHPIGQSTHNLTLRGIYADETTATTRIVGSLYNHSVETIQTTAELLLENRAVDVRVLEIPPRSARNVIFRLPASVSEKGGKEKNVLVEMRLRVDDDLALDNRSGLLLGQAERARVTLVGTNPVWEAAFNTTEARALAEVQFLPATAARTFDQTPAGRDWVIFDNCTPLVAPATSALYVGGFPAYWNVGRVVPVENCSVIQWHSAHPLFRYVELGDSRIHRALVSSAPVVDGVPATPIIEANSGIVGWSAARGPWTDYVLTFPIVDGDILGSDWPLRDFPLFALNLLRMAAGNREAGRALTPGEKFLVTAPIEETGTPTVEYPDGSRRTLSAIAPGRFELSDTDQLGVYQLRWPQGTRQRMVVNLTDAAETAIRPAPGLTLGNVILQPAAVGITRDYWRLLMSLALVILLGEWCVYHRRWYT